MIASRIPLRYHLWCFFFGVWYGAWDEDLPGLGLELYGSHEVVSPRGEQRVLGNGRIGVLPTCALPWADAPIAEASIAEVLPEVVDGRYAHLSGSRSLTSWRMSFFAFSTRNWMFFASMMKFFQLLFCEIKISFYICIGKSLDCYRRRDSNRWAGLYPVFFLICIN